nr:WbqC family protein [Pararobbsia silviterrae]
MQPYFFPYLGHYQLILACDHWIVFDVVKYSARSWMNRNRILHPTQGWQYVGVPVAHRSTTAIHDVMLVDKGAAQRRVLGQLNHYRGKSPYFERVCELVRQAFSRTATLRLVDLNVQTLSVVCDYLGIPFKWSLCSELDLDLSGVDHAGQWALAITTAFGATRYINPPGGRDIFVSEEWRKAKIDLRFIEPATLTYSVDHNRFEPNMSVLDVLMWNDPDVVRSFLQRTIRIVE